MITILTILNMAAAAVIVAHGVFAVINSMGRHTGHGMRLAWSILTTGALGVLVGPLFDKLPPGPSWTIMLVGLAASILFERRKPGKLRGMP